MHLFLAVQTEFVAKEAEPRHREHLKQLEALLGEDHPTTLVAVTNLADALRAQGNIQEAEPYYARALEEREKIYFPTDALVLQSALGFGLTLMGLRKYEAAEEQLRKAALLDSWHPFVHSLEDPEVLKHTTELLRTRVELCIAATELCSCLIKLKKAEEGEVLQRRALDCMEKTSIGADHAHVLKGVRNMAILLDMLGRQIESTPYRERDLEGVEKRLGTDSADPEVLMCVLALAACMQLKGEHQEALDLHRRGLELRERIHGPNHADTIASAQTLAECCCKLECWGEAEPLFSRCLVHWEDLESSERMEEVLEETRGERISEKRREERKQKLALWQAKVDTLVDEVVECLVKLERWEEVEPYQVRQLKRAEETIGCSEKKRLSLQLAIIQTGLRLQKWPDVLEKASVLFRKMEEVFGKTHLQTMAALNAVAICQLNLEGPFKETEDMFLAVQAVYRADLGMDDDRYIGVLTSLCDLYTARGKPFKEESSRRELLDLLVVVGGAGSARAEEAAELLVKCYIDLAKFEEARLLLESKVQRRQNDFGNDADETVEAQLQLVDCCKAISPAHERIAEVMKQVLSVHDMKLGRDCEVTRKLARDYWLCLVDRGEEMAADAEMALKRVQQDEERLEREQNQAAIAALEAASVAEDSMREAEKAMNAALKALADGEEKAAEAAAEAAAAAAKAAAATIEVAEASIAFLPEEEAVTAAAPMPSRLGTDEPKPQTRAQIQGAAHHDINALVAASKDSLVRCTKAAEQAAEFAKSTADIAATAAMEAAERAAAEAVALAAKAPLTPSDSSDEDDDESDED